MGAIDLYVSTQRLLSLLAIPCGVALTMLVGAIFALAGGDKFEPETRSAKWDTRRALSLALVVVFPFGATLVRSAGLSPWIYLPMLGIGTTLTVVSLKQTRRTSTGDDFGR
jgi:hypothetical protein